MKQLNLLKTMFLLCALIVGSNAWAADDTITFSELGLENGVQYTEAFNGGDFTVTFAGGSNDGKYYNTGSGIRVYGNGTMTIAATGTKKLAKIELTFDGSNKPTSNNVVDGGTYDNTTGTWTGSAESVVFTRPSGSGHWRVKSVAVTYEAGGPADTRIATTVEIDASGLTNTNCYIGTDAGTLAATVKAGETTVGSTVTWSGNNNEVATINGSTGAVTLVAAGTVTFTATYEGDEDYKPSTKTYELTVINDNPNAITLWSEDFSGYDDDDVPSGTTYSYSCTDGSNGTTKIYKTGTMYAGGASPELLISKNGGKFQATIPLYNVDGEMTLTFKTNNANLVVSSTTTGVSLSGDTQAGTTTVTISDITADMTSLVIIFTNNASGNSRLDDIVLKGSLITPATMSVKGLASFASPYPLDLADLPEGLKAYKASLATGDVVTLDEVTAAVPAGTGLILKGTANESYNIPVAASADELTGNLLVGVTEAAGKTVTADEAYALSKTDGKFHMVTSGLTIPQGKAYLPAGNLSAHELVLSFVDGETTAINEVKGLKADVRGEYFNLNGQRVAQPTKGLYIVNGKKVVIR